MTIGVAHPAMLLLLGTLPWLWIVMRRGAAGRAHAAQQFGSANTRAGFSKRVISLSAAACVVVAMAQPFFREPAAARPAKPGGQGDVVFLLDVSRSMLSTDVEGTRLDHAKQVITDLILKQPEDRFALIVFAGTASVECALTTDRVFFGDALRLVGPESVSRGGTRIGDALRLAAASGFDDVRRDEKRVVLLTDGGDHQPESEKAASEAHRQGLQLTVIGVGGDQPVPVPTSIQNPAPVAYRGEIVRTHLEEESLRRLATAAQGEYWNARAPRPLKHRAAAVEPVSTGTAGSILLAALAFVLLAIEGFTLRPTRRTAVASTVTLALLAGLIPPPALDAQTGSEAWAAKGLEEYGKNHFVAAVEAYQSAIMRAPDRPELRYNLACSYYALQRYDDALSAYAKGADLTAKGSDFHARCKLGMGNALYALADRPKLEEEITHLKAALSAYQDALRLRDENPDVAYNIAVVERRLASLANPKQDEAQQPAPQDALAVIRGMKSSGATPVPRPRPQSVEQDW